MAQVDLSPKAEQYATQLAQVTGATVSQAVEEAVRERWSRVAPASYEAPTMEELMSLLSRADDVPKPASVQTEDEILGTNGFGAFDEWWSMLRCRRP